VYRILVTGSRAWSDEEALLDALAHAVVTGLWHHENVVVAHGACPAGADAMAEQICHARGIRTEPHPADWEAPCRPECPRGHRGTRHDGSTWCPSAGHYRNQHMVDLGAHACVAAFQPGAINAGTSDCVRRAIAAGIPVTACGDVPVAIRRLLDKQAAALPGL
jgi:hypothetical protein